MVAASRPHAGSSVSGPAVSGGTSPAANTGLLDAFRKHDFNVAAFVRDATGQGQERLRRLTQQLEDCASSLDEELQREIVACHEDLLQNASNVNDLDQQLGDVQEVVEALKNSVARLRGDVLSPFASVRRRTELLERMQAVSVLIRKLLRFLFDARKLRTQMDAPTKDYSKAAHTLHDLESVLAEGTIDRVEALRAELMWIRETGARVRRQAEEDLRTGTRQGNQVALSGALQIFFNLQCLRPQLLALLSEMLEDFKSSQLVTGPGFQQSLDVNLQILVQHTQRIYVLGELIRSKTDPLTHRSYSVALEDGEGGIASLVGHFWAQATGILTAKFAKISQDRAARRSLLAEFPKVLNSLSDAADRLHPLGRGRGHVLRVAEREALCAVVADLRGEFLAESIRRVTEPVEMMLPERLLSRGSNVGTGGQGVGAVQVGADGGTDELPTTHDLRRYALLLSAELERSECCPEQLFKEVARNVRSSVLLFATRLEQTVDMSCVEIQCFEDETLLKLRSVMPLPAAGNVRNARLFGIAHHALLALKEAIPARFQAVVITQQVQTTLQQTQTAIVSPIFGALRRAVRASVVQLGCGADRNADGSVAIAVVGQACAHVSRYYFALFGDGQLSPYLKEFCAVVIRSFLSAAVLVKPCSESTRRQLLQDMQSVEMMLSAMDTDFQTNVRYESTVLGEFRKLLFARSVETVHYEDLLEVIPLHLLLTYLVQQLPVEVPSLPQFCGVSPASYLSDTLLPLWGAQTSAIDKFKASVADLSDRHGLDPTESPMVAFIMAQSA
eukprot:TRINITY_DN43205_c0_g1_i1.p1 TRINITY_DN43205_c0_g1~~TRINITY_DN43205_c0_g1_i1.p1  ORF type:complete len:813 (-),score=133.35 TRINITY_DN43205_c0_g1_i1:129-2492(-)